LVACLKTADIAVEPAGSVMVRPNTRGFPKLGMADFISPEFRRRRDRLKFLGLGG
jgi:hypothetical protein